MQLGLGGKAQEGFTCGRDKLGLLGGTDRGRLMAWAREEVGRMRAWLGPKGMGLFLSLAKGIFYFF